MAAGVGGNRIRGIGSAAEVAVLKAFGAVELLVLDTPGGKFRFASNVEGKGPPPSGIKYAVLVGFP